jgi:hypothetical protein
VGTGTIDVRIERKRGRARLIDVQASGLAVSAR